jgi:hypothetical protein
LKRVDKWHISRLLWNSCFVLWKFSLSQVAARAKESEEKQTLVDQAELSIGRNGAFAKLRDVTVKPVRNYIYQIGNCF